MEAIAAGWLNRGRGFYDGLLASARFRNWAASFPLTRIIARRRARALFDVCAGFVYSQVLYACVRLQLFEILFEGPQTSECLAPRLGLSLEATHRLLDAAISLRLVARSIKGAYRLGPLGLPMVGNAAIAAMVEHHALLYADLRDPVALLRKGAAESEIARYWPYAACAEGEMIEAGRVAGYSALMSVSQPLVAGEVLNAFSFRRYRCLLDLGGGEGTFLAAVAAQYPDLKLVLFDLPPVADRARVQLASAGLAHRAHVVGGDFLRESLPPGADIVSLVRVLHDHDDAAALDILRAARRALPVDGVLLIAEPLASTRGAEPVGAAYFGFYLLAMGRGKPRTPAQIKGLLRCAGFQDPQHIPTRMPLQTGLISAVAA